MKILFYLLFIFILVSCEVEVDSKDDRTPCEKAKDHIYQCVEYLPSFTCTSALAEKILNTECENIEKLWR
jgi:hypothetical protein